jgi:hypothetical protein
MMPPLQNPQMMPPINAMPNPAMMPPIMNPMMYGYQYPQMDYMNQ